MTRPQLLHDKIEEAQKKLNSPEESQKEISDTGSRRRLDAAKGVKRKKIVTENNLKKIPKSPLRNVPKDKQKHDLEAFSSPNNPSGSDCSKEKYLLPRQNLKQNSKQSKSVGRSDLIVESVKCEASMQAKNPSIPPDLCNGRSEDCDFRNKLTSSAELSVSRTSQSNQKSANVSYENKYKQSSCANSPFDVLLKAMEPELNTLNESWPPCGTQTEKQGLNKISTSYTSNAGSKLSTSQHGITSKYLHHLCASHSDQICSSADVSQHVRVYSSSDQERHCYTALQKQQPTTCLSFSDSLETIKHQQGYQLAKTSSNVHPSSSTATQVLSLPGNTTSPTNHSKLSGNSTYNLTQVASLISGEQMCNIVLKDQKPKKQGKYICEYCNRACAKPSVLLKHIRSHTGERPYPCVTCGFSFKTKSNLYKHKKSHAHAIKLGLGLQSDSEGMILSHDSDKTLCIHSDVDDSGESDDEYTQEDSLSGHESSEKIKISPGASSHKENSMSYSTVLLQETSVQEKSIETRLTAPPKVVVYPVSISPLRADSPKCLESSEHFVAQMPEFKVKNKNPNILRICSLSDTEQSSHMKCEVAKVEDKPPVNMVNAHAQLQRQQATDFSQDQQSKCLLSPRSLGSTDSGYFSRSESADQAMSPPTPLLKFLPASEKDFSKNVTSLSQTGTSVVQIIHPVSVDKPTIITGTMRPPLGTKSLEERISKLISDNEAVVDNKQLDSVKPRRTSLSRRGSIDSPKSYIFKDSFQFDLKPVGRRTSSSSDIPKSPFTPTDKSKQVFFLSVPSQFPSIDCLPITRSNSMPTTGYSAIPTVIPPSHTLRGSQSFDEKIGSMYDDVFISGPSTPQQVAHPRMLVRQAAVEDSSTAEHCGLGPARSVDESYTGSKVSPDLLLPRSKSFVQSSSLDKSKKAHQVRGTMFECGTCRNRYRKLENFENHKKFYCSELHGPKSKTVRETEHNSNTSSTQPQILHYRVASSTGSLEQPLQFRKRRKMKSVGDDDEPPQNDGHSISENTEITSAGNIKNSSTITILGSQSCSVSTFSPQLVPRSTDNVDINLSTVEKKISFSSQETVELKCQGTGISVIQHTNSLSRPNSFEKLESVDRGSPITSYDLHKPTVSHTACVDHEDGSRHNYSQTSSSRSLEISISELNESQRMISTDRNTLATQSRLVRQHNIQVPEILVTEEPDKDLDNQINDQELLEKFSWPQRSGSLSSLPTEKLPPKKKRIRLADLEQSSAESSFDSTLSRSLSRESSLSRASSFSASFDKEDSSKPEAPSKGDPGNKSLEFLTIPSGLNTFGVPREMRRAASEQINCTQPSVEAMEYRSKSFDCGSMSRSRSMSPTIITTPTSQACTTNSGHVPLLERRRGPLVKQISLNIGPEGNIPVAKSKFPNQLSENKHFSHSNVKSMERCHTEVNVSLKETTKEKSVSELQFSDQSSKLPIVSSIQQLDSSGLPNVTNASLLNNDLFTSILNTSKRDDKEGTSSSNGKDCFAPKYQLCIQKFHESQSCSSKPLINMLPYNRALTETIPEAHSSKSWQLASPDSSSMNKHNKSNNFSSKIQNAQSVSVPVHNYSISSYYGFSAISTLPEILVTQYQVNQVVCKTSTVPVPNSRNKSLIPKCYEETSHTILIPQKASLYEGCFSESAGGKFTELETVFQKMPVAGLLPQQEIAASSKRMLSPANSLDIAMEKQQKRVKDENGAACNTSIQPTHLLGLKTSEPSKQRKPMLVRQLCTTDPNESLDQDPIIALGKNDQENSSSGSLLSDFCGSKHLVASCSEDKNECEKKSNEQPCSAVAIASVSSLVNFQRSVFSSQDRSAVSTKAVHLQGQVKLGAAISVVNVGDMQRLSFPSLKTLTSFTWCYLLKRKPMHVAQNDQKTSAYASWNVSPNNPNPLGLATKVALSLLNSKQKSQKFIFTQVKTTHARCDTLVYSSKWKRMTKKSSGNLQGEQTNSESSAEQDKEPFLNKNEPRRVKIFDGGFKSNEEYVYVRGRGRGKYICEECGIRCKKPSMLKKHIRTHTDVRPYHCNYCNFSFKTKGNLTKHMKSKAHSKKCMDMGIAVGPVDEHDTDDSGERQRYGDRSGFDVDDSDGPDEDDNDIEDEDEDSQAESILSATPSVTASPQHYSYRSSQQEVSSADEDLRMSHGFVQSNSIDILPKALITRMTALTTKSDSSPENPNPSESLVQNIVNQKSETAFPKSLCHQMSVDYPDTEDSLESSTEKTKLSVSNDSPSLNIPSSPVDRSTQTMDSSADTTHSDFHQHKPTKAPPQAAQMAPSHTHLFSHLPLHSQQHVRSPYSMIPVGGIQLVPAGLAAYSTFVPLQAGPVQLTIPAVGVIHRTTSAVSEKVAEVPNNSSPIGVAEVNGVVPCIPIGQVNMHGIGTSTLQPIQPLNMETLNILGLTNTNIAPQIHPSGLTLNAVGLQVVAASHSPHNNPSPQTHIPGLQILNIALPTIIPSISPLTVEGHAVPDKSPSCSTAPAQSPASFAVADNKTSKPNESPKVSPRMERHHTTSSNNVAEEKRTTSLKTSDNDKLKNQQCDISSSQIKTSSTPDHILNVSSEGSHRSVSQTFSPLTHRRRAEMVSRQNTVQFSDTSSDDEDKLVIET
ncbi:zinc finger protein 40 [Bombina bombina]|uniref:zinc finger protein 40 n=1 Tax=Bombina bombina TaxID=8345 RepID=UPI00235AF329|nr:zinc finger protein 40 [Bombina bombina]